MANHEGDLQAPQFEELSGVDKDIQKRKTQRQAARRGRRGGGKEGLTITSLMDALTILLVFLLVSITSDPLNVKQDDNLLLARSTVDYSPGDDSIPIVVTKQHIIVDNATVVQVECTLDGRMCTNEPLEGTAAAEVKPDGDIQALNYCSELPAPDDCSPEDMERLGRMRFRVDKSYKQDGNEEQFLILPLHKKLQQLVKNQKEENLALGREFRGVTTIISDASVPFRMLAEVVHTAGMAELSDIRFAVVKTSDR